LHGNFGIGAPLSKSKLLLVKFELGPLQIARSLATFSDHSSLNELKRSTTKHNFQRTWVAKTPHDRGAPIPTQRDTTKMA
jgi:hypothetical protein